MRRVALLVALVLGCSADEVEFREAEDCSAVSLCPTLKRWCASIADDAGSPCHELAPYCEGEGDAAGACVWAVKACHWADDCDEVEPLCKPCL